MIAFGRIIPLEKLAKEDYSDIYADPSSPQARLKHDHPEGALCDPGFTHLSNEYLMGYNSLVQVSNYRNIIDCFKDTAVVILLYMYLKDMVPVYYIGIPILANTVLMLPDLIVLKKHNHAEAIDIAVGIILSLLGYFVIREFKNSGEWLVTLCVVYLSFEIVMFLFIRLFQRRYNKNTGISLAKIGFSCQVLMIALHNKGKLPNTSTYVIFSVFLAYAGIFSGISVLHVYFTLWKIPQIKRILSLRSFF